MTNICPVSKLDTLLLSTDGSEYSEGAVREAVKLAKLYSGKLLAISIIETNPEFETIAPQYVEKAEGETRKNLESVKARAAGEGVSCEIISRHTDEPYKAIVEEAEKNRADLIVMGRRGRTGLKRLLMGSVTAKVIGHSPCNVLVVPRAADIKFKNILIATDGSKYSMAAASEAMGIAKRCDASLFAIAVVQSETISPFDIVHAEMQRDLIAKRELEDAERNVNELNEIAKKEGVRIECSVIGGRPYEAIVETARSRKADLILMGSHGRTGVDRLLMGSVTERVVGNADCAVLVVKTV
jgi:nucleotide-binding universal stress UspA family protein